MILHVNQVGEVGEISELFQWKGKTEVGLNGMSLHFPAKIYFSNLDWSEAQKYALGDEIADVFLYIIRLADRCGIDLTRYLWVAMCLRNSKCVSGSEHEENCV